MCPLYLATYNQIPFRLLVGYMFSFVFAQGLEFEFEVCFHACTTPFSTYGSIYASMSDMQHRDGHDATDQCLHRMSVLQALHFLLVEGHNQPQLVDAIRFPPRLHLLHLGHRGPHYQGQGDPMDICFCILYCDRPPASLDGGTEVQPSKIPFSDPTQ